MPSTFKDSESVPTFEEVFHRKAIESSVFKMVTTRVNTELLDSPWVGHLGGYLISVMGISGITNEVYAAVISHYAKYNWEVSVSADKLIFEPHIHYGVKT